jgi:predicted AAA+ superfamily ATPase
MGMIERTEHLRRLRSLMRQFPVVGILGARQVGKTTLAQQLVQTSRGRVTYFDLESAEDLARLADPMLALRPLTGLIVLDEVQRRPDLFTQLRVLVDEPSTRRKFLVLGSASPDLLRQTSETLAGRIAYHELGGFSLEEVGLQHWSKLWHRGGFPRSFLARSESDSLQWRKATLRRFWMMLAHTTVQRYLDLLSATFMVRQLPAWHENIGKRQVKAPKVYLRDSGLLHALLGLEGGWRPRCGRDATRGASGRMPFLGGPLRSGARSARRSGRGAARIRVQEDHGAGHDALDARRDRGPSPLTAGRRPRGSTLVRDASEDPSDRAEPSARGSRAAEVTVRPRRLSSTQTLRTIEQRAC